MRTTRMLLLLLYEHAHGMHAYFKAESTWYEVYMLGVDLLILYEYLCDESARFVLPRHLRGRTVWLITCGTVQLFFDFLLHPPVKK